MNRHDLLRPSMNLGDFFIDDDVLRCLQCDIGPGQTRAPRVQWSETPYTLLQFVLAAEAHVKSHHAPMRWAP